MLRRDTGAIWKGALLLLAVFFLTAAVLAYTFGYVVEPGDFGVRQIKFDLHQYGLKLGPKQGYSQTGLKPGYHWSIPFYSTIHLVPERVQTMHFDRSDADSSKVSSLLEIQTTDGSSVDVDISVFYRFFRERQAGDVPNGGPADLFATVGLRQQWRPYIEQIVVNELKKALGYLSTSQFYDPKLREEQVLLAQENLSRRLAPEGIGIEAVLLRRYTYQDQSIDNEIFEKNLQDQEERFNEASSRLAAARANLEKEAANWDARIKTYGVEGENTARVIVSEADLYEARQVAQGDLAVAKARAEADRLRAEALGTEGGRRLVAVELAPVVQSLRGGLVADINPYDFDQWLRFLGAEE